MIRHLFTAPAVFLAGMLAGPSIGHAQTFKVEKFDIKGDGGTDYIAAESATGRVFVSRGTHMMVVDGRDRQSLGRHSRHAGRPWRGHRHQVRPRVYNQRRRLMTVTMFDLKTLAVIKQIMVVQRPRRHHVRRAG